MLVSNGTCPKFKRSQTETLSNWNANDALEKYKGKVLLLISGRHEDLALDLWWSGTTGLRTSMWMYRRVL